jgi:hypothetical protein
LLSANGQSINQRLRRNADLVKAVLRTAEWAQRADQWDYDVISQWNDPGDSASHIQWTRDFWTAVEPFATGEVYVDHLDSEEARRIRAAYGPGYERLVAPKNKYDPTSSFGSTRTSSQRCKREVVLRGPGEEGKVDSSW